jgi:DNA (cytosine-5)-methyltransferase 1
LFFYFIQIAEKLKPRVVIAENVSGLLKGNAKGYVNEIFKAFDAAGYKTQLFLLNAAFMGVPQKRERCFFIAQRNDQGFPKLKLQFDEKPIVFGEVRSEHGKTIDPIKAKDTFECLKHIDSDDDSLADIKKRIYGKNIGFTNVIFQDGKVAHSLCSNGLLIRACDKSWLTEDDCKNIQSFPQDYDFCDQTAQYICGMSVPPVMMAQVSAEVYSQWLKP